MDERWKRKRLLSWFTDRVRSTGSTVHLNVAESRVEKLQADEALSLKQSPAKKPKKNRGDLSVQIWLRQTFLLPLLTSLFTVTLFICSSFFFNHPSHPLSFYHSLDIVHIYRTIAYNILPINMEKKIPSIQSCDRFVQIQTTYTILTFRSRFAGLTRTNLLCISIQLLG